MRKLTKITVNLTPRSKDALDRTVNRIEENSTDVIGRALLVYDWMTEQVGAGGKVLTRQPDGSEVTAVLL